MLFQNCVKMVGKFIFNLIVIIHRFKVVVMYFVFCCLFLWQSRWTLRMCVNNCAIQYFLGWPPFVTLSSYLVKILIFYLSQDISPTKTKIPPQPPFTSFIYHFLCLLINKAWTIIWSIRLCGNTWEFDKNSHFSKCLMCKWQKWSALQPDDPLYYRN